MRRAGRNVVAVVGVVALLLAVVPSSPCAESVRSAETHGCCAPPPGLRAADHACCGSLTDATLVVSVPSPPPTAPIVGEARGVLAAESPGPMHQVASLPRPACSPPFVLRI